jgi:hypothetical protein
MGASPTLPGSDPEARASLAEAAFELDPADGHREHATAHLAAAHPRVRQRDWPDGNPSAVHQADHQPSTGDHAHPARQASRDAFSRRNPELAWVTQTSDPQAARQLLRDAEDTNLRGDRVRIAEHDENDRPQGLALRAGLVADRAAQAHARAARRAREHSEAAFTRLNPDFGVLPDQRDPAQQRFAADREQALALGTRVAEALRTQHDGSDRWLLAEERPTASPGVWPRAQRPTPERIRRGPER